MRAVTWQGPREISVEDVADPVIEQPTDAIIRVTSTGLCGSDLHLYEPLSAFMTPGDVVGHEPMGIVEQVGPEVGNLAPGDRVVVPFNVSCGSCWMCRQGLQSQCETTQNHEHGTGASLFGYSKLYGEVPGGQAELLRVPFADYGPVKVPQGPPDDRFVLLSDVLPTAWQAVEYAGITGAHQTVLVLGAGPIGDMATRIAVARQMVLHAATLRDAGRPCLTEAAMAKLYASEMAEEVCSAAIQVHGGYGYVSDYLVEKIWRDVRVCQIYEGTSDVQRILIGRGLASL